MEHDASPETGPTRPPAPLSPPTALRRAFAILDVMTQLAFNISAAILLAVTVLYCMEIALRYFFLSPTIWTRDTITYLLCAILLLASPQVARNNSHVAITILVELFDARTRHRIETVLALLTAFISAGVCWITAQETIRLFNSNILTLGTIAVPKWWISIFIPLGFSLVSLQFLSQAVDRTRRGHDRTKI